MKPSTGLVVLLAVACAKASPPAEPTKEAPVEPATPQPEVETEVNVALDLDAFDLPSAIRRDWLEKDLVLFPKVAQAFPVESLATTVAQLESVGNDCTPRDQGFGIEVWSCTASGGYSTCNLTAVSHKGVLLDGKAQCRTSSEEKWPDLEPVIRKLDEATLAPKGFVRDGRFARLMLRDDEALARAKAALAAELGPPSGATASAELQPAFDVLTSPRGRVVIGTACGAAGSPPHGNREMHALVEAGRDDLLRDAMRSPNAGGRVYGYIGLKLLGKNTADDDKAWNALRSLEIAVPTCGGCMVTNKKATEIDVDIFRRR